jgi:hypothetical protein
MNLELLISIGPRHGGFLHHLPVSRAFCRSSDSRRQIVGDPNFMREIETMSSRSGVSVEMARNSKKPDSARSEWPIQKESTLAGHALRQASPIPRNSPATHPPFMPRTPIREIRLQAQANKPVPGQLRGDAQQPLCWKMRPTQFSS